ALCQENLVYRCDLIEGARRDLLCRFQYFGVPDEVDYRNIPWRNSRFDEDELTRHVATQSRARNAYEQLQKRGGPRPPSPAWRAPVSTRTPGHTISMVNSLAVGEGNLILVCARCQRPCEQRTECRRRAPTHDLEW